MLGAGSAEPPMPGESELLLQEMQALGVCGALVVQPSCYGHDHSYVTAALKAHPGRLVGCLLADPHPGVCLSAVCVTTEPPCIALYRPPCTALPVSPCTASCSTIPSPGTYQQALAVIQAGLHVTCH